MSDAEEQQVRELVAKMQFYQQRIDLLQQQMGMVQLSVSDIDNALKALSTLEGIKPGHEMMVPIGAGSYVYATVSDPEKVLIGLGAGVSVEKNAADSRVILTGRRAELEKLLMDGNNELNFAANELMKLQQEAQKYQ